MPRGSPEPFGLLMSGHEAVGKTARCRAHRVRDLRCTDCDACRNNARCICQPTRLSTMAYAFRCVPQQHVNGHIYSSVVVRHGFAACDWSLFSGAHQRARLSAKAQYTEGTSNFTRNFKTDCAAIWHIHTHAHARHLRGGRTPSRLSLPNRLFDSVWPQGPPLCPPAWRTVQRKRGNAANRGSAAVPRKRRAGEGW